jgi:hypothetical protein
MRTRIRTILLALAVLSIACLATAQADVEVGVEASTQFGVSAYTITTFYLPLTNIEDANPIDTWLQPEFAIYRGTTFRGYARAQVLLEFGSTLTIGIDPIYRFGAWDEWAIRAYARFSK